MSDRWKTAIFGFLRMGCVLSTMVRMLINFFRMSPNRHRTVLFPVKVLMHHEYNPLSKSRVQAMDHWEEAMCAVLTACCSVTTAAKRAT